MAISLNQANILGTVGSVKLKTTQSGKNVLDFSVATNFRTKKGESFEDHTTWHRVALWEPSEYVIKNVTKGSRVMVTGRIDNREYQDLSGAKRTASSIIAFDLVPLGSSKSSQAAQPQTYQTQPQAQNEKPAQSYDDDIPF